MVIKNHHGPVEIDGLPIILMVDLSMANWQCHNQMVDHGDFAIKPPASSG